ncbi:MAG TPA: CHRD domain-containing protein [Mycobacterium sp.]|nr:CHRD domain-containing protein [Mycobacterium sp.]
MTATVQMVDFTPNSSHAMHIHQGSCAAAGNVVVPFPDVTANSEGVIDTTVTSLQPAPNGLTAGTSLNIHLAPSSQLGDPGSLGFTPIGCGDINPAASETLTMAPPPQPGQRPQASVQTTYDPAKKTLSVAVTASGLTPGSGHAQHLHHGTCASPKLLPAGPLEYPLDDLVASPTGSATVTKVFSNVDQNLGGWYLNVHLGSSDQLFHNGNLGDPTLYFAPIMCGNIGT